MNDPEETLKELSTIMRELTNELLTLQQNRVRKHGQWRAQVGTAAVDVSGRTITVVSAPHWRPTAQEARDFGTLLLAAATSAENFR